MKCTGCFEELNEGEKAYATVVGSIEQFEGDYNGLGFYPDKTESWITVLCEKCGMEIHNLIAEQLQAKHL
ncbi:MAG: hypothetical protein KAU17_11030 [Spirochaetales bacterium]|nr:hypothetical protein [Spirochaetales bacterium]